MLSHPEPPPIARPLSTRESSDDGTHPAVARAGGHAGPGGRGVVRARGVEDDRLHRHHQAQQPRAQRPQRTRRPAMNGGPAALPRPGRSPSAARWPAPRTKIHPMKPEDHTPREGALRRLDTLSYVLDNSIPIPGTRRRFGLDALIGLVPGVGDATGALMSA